MNLTVAGGTDVGRYRKNNEDALVEVTSSDGARLIVVADGMGGFEAGEVASAEAVTAAKSAWFEGVGESLEWRAARCIGAANQAVVAAAHAAGHFGNMGTTIVLAATHRGQVLVAHVGDSRGYVLRAGTIVRVTVDHTESAALAAEGKISWEESDHHELSHCLTNCLGLADYVEPDITEREGLLPGDTLLLCSDGLSDMVDDVEIQDVLRYFAPSEAVAVLTRLANFRGGPDNITIQVVRVGADRPLEARPDDFRLDYEGFALRLLLAVAILIAVVGGAILAIWWLAS